MECDFPCPTCHPDLGSGPEAGLREALARAIAGGYADDSIDPDLYHSDPVFHAVVYEARQHRLAATPTASPTEREVYEQRLTRGALSFYADQMPAYAAAAGLSKDEYAAVMVDVEGARVLLRAASPTATGERDAYKVLHDAKSGPYGYASQEQLKEIRKAKKVLGIE